MVKENVCVYRDYINCAEHTNCAKCGWNPKVEEKRKAKLAEKKEGD